MHYYVIFDNFFLEGISMDHRRVVDELLTNCEWTIENSLI